MFKLNINNPTEMANTLKDMRKVGDKLRAIATPFLTEDLSDKERLEFCHLAKFIFAFDEKIRIIEKRESPDFIVEYGKKRFGLELARIFDPKEVQNINSKKELFKKAANEFEAKYPNNTILANFWLLDGFRFTGNQKNSLVEEIVEFTYELISGNKPNYPNFIKDIFITKHTGVDFNFNEGAYMSKDLPSTNLIEAINKKEAKVDEYKANTGIDAQWLLLVNGIGSDSFNTEDVEMPEKIESQFEHIYLLQDFEGKVIKIK